MRSVANILSSFTLLTLIPLSSLAQSRADIEVTKIKPENPVYCNPQKGTTTHYLNIMRSYVDLDAVGAYLFSHKSHVAQGEKVVLTGYVYGVTCEPIDREQTPNIPVVIPEDAKFAFVYQPLQNFPQIKSFLINNLDTKTKSDDVKILFEGDKNLRFQIELSVDDFFNEKDAKIVKAGEALKDKKLSFEFEITDPKTGKPAKTSVFYTYDVLKAVDGSSQVILNRVP